MHFGQTCPEGQRAVQSSSGAWVCISDPSTHYSTQYQQAQATSTTPATESGGGGGFLSTILGSGMEIVKGLLGAKPPAPAPFMPMAPPPPKIPTWVYIAVPAALGVVVLLLVVRPKRTYYQAPAMAGYRRRRARKAR